MTIRIDDKLKNKLDCLAKATERTKSFLAVEAIKNYVTLNDWQVKEIEESIQEAEQNNFATDKEIKEVFEKWK